MNIKAEFKRNCFLFGGVKNYFNPRGKNYIGTYYLTLYFGWFVLEINWPEKHEDKVAWLINQHT